ncbi:MAG: hypothetical protein KBT72_09100 [Zhongshania sp.]|jgi:hypothetical protein|nr:hypothetical protein [Zhongshania sp.]
MKLLKEFHDGNFDLAIYGVGFEERATHCAKIYLQKKVKSIAIGYDINTDKFNYQKNKSFFTANGAEVYEGSDISCVNYLDKFLSTLDRGQPKNILLDITVMSRHRLAGLIFKLLDILPPKSKISITYSLSKFVEPPPGNTPIRSLGEILPQLTGALGDLSLPSAVIFGLGYEKGKASGVLNFLDPSDAYIFIPSSPVKKFRKLVVKNNSDLFDNIPSDNIFDYDVCDPYSTYLTLRSLVLSIKSHCRPLLIPLGPKILASLCVILGKELYPTLPVWRVSSDFEETPINRVASGIKIEYTIEV